MKTMACFVLSCCSFCVVADVNNAEDIETIEVTAQGKVESINDIPISISYLSDSFLEQFKFDSVERLTQSVPGVFVSKNSGASKMYIRGIGAQGNAGLEQALSVYYDGVYHGRSRNSKSMLVDVERLELLKGPQSVYLGLNASAGAMAIHSRKPTFNGNDGYVMANIGENNGFSTRFGYNRVIADNWAIRVAGEKADSDGPWTMIDNQGNNVGKGGGENSHLFRLSTLFRDEQSDEQRFSALLKLETQSQRKQNPFAWQPGGCDNLYALGLSSQQQLNEYWQNTGSSKNNPLKVPATCKDNFIDNQFDEFSPASPFNDSIYQNQLLTLQLNWQWNNWHLHSTSGYFDSHYGFDGNDLSHGTNAHRFMWSEDDDRQLSQHIKFFSDDGRDFDFMLGAYWHQNHVDFQSADVDGRAANNLQYNHTAVQQQSETTALYGAFDWYISPKWTLTTGIRYEHIKKVFDASDVTRNKKFYGAEQGQGQAFADLLLNDTDGNPLLYQQFTPRLRSGFSDEKVSFDHFMPSMALKYHYGTNSLVYYKLTKGLKSGGFNFRLNNLDADTLTYDSERVLGHELGVKHGFFAQQLRLSAAMFDSSYRDLQQNSNRDHLGNSSTAVIRNAAKAHSRGVELEANWYAFENLSFGLSATYLDAQFDDYQGADCTRLQAVVVKTDVAQAFGAQQVAGKGCFQDLSGQPLPMAPQFASRLSVEHQLSLGDYRLNSALQWFYSDGFYTSPHADKLRYQQAFDKFHLRVELAPKQGDWHVAILGYNLTNKLTARQLGQDGNAAVSGLVDLPRQIQLQVKYNF